MNDTKQKLFDRLEDKNNEAIEAEADFLHAFGWNYALVGSWWLWSKEIDGRLVSVSQKTAVNLELGEAGTEPETAVPHQETIAWIDIDHRKPTETGYYLVMLGAYKGYSDYPIIDFCFFMDRTGNFDGGGAFPHFEDGCEILYWAEAPKGPQTAVEGGSDE